MTLTDIYDFTEEYVKAGLPHWKAEVSASLGTVRFGLVYPCWAAVTGPLLRPIVESAVNHFMGLAHEFIDVLDAFNHIATVVDPKVLSQARKAQLKAFTELARAYGKNPHPSVSAGLSALRLRR
jgi:hypothetical protein